MSPVCPQELAPTPCPSCVPRPTIHVRELSLLLMVLVPRPRSGGPQSLTLPQSVSSPPPSPVYGPGCRGQTAPHVSQTCPPAPAHVRARGKRRQTGPETLRQEQCCVFPAPAFSTENRTHERLPSPRGRTALRAPGQTTAGRSSLPWIPLTATQMSSLPVSALFQPASRPHHHGRQYRQFKDSSPPLLAQRLCGSSVSPEHAGAWRGEQCTPWAAVLCWPKPWRPQRRYSAPFSKVSQETDLLKASTPSVRSPSVLAALTQCHRLEAYKQQKCVSQSGGWTPGVGGQHTRFQWEQTSCFAGRRGRGLSGV